MRTLAEVDAELDAGAPEAARDKTRDLRTMRGSETAAFRNRHRARMLLFAEKWELLGDEPKALISRTCVKLGDILWGTPIANT